VANSINLFGLGLKSRSSNVTAAHRLNCFYDQQVDHDKVTVSAVGTPGLTLFCKPSIHKAYGMHWMQNLNLLFVFQGGALYKVPADGVPELCFDSGIDINNRVSMANNGKELLCVTGKFAFIYNTETGVLSSLTGIIPYEGQLADTCTFLDGRFIINRPGTGQFFISGLYDGLTWDGLDFATAESTPDNLTAVVADKGVLVLLGEVSVEFWQNSGELLFSFARINATPSESGLAARWSLSKCNGYLTGLFRNKTGQLQICMIDGYTVTPVSNDDMTYIINQYAVTGDATGFGYSMNGKSFYEITFPSEDVTWLYEAESQSWSQIKTGKLNRHRVEIGAAFDRKFIVSDYENGNLYVLDQNNYTDNGEMITRQITGSHVFAASRNRMTISRLRVDMEGGVGLNTGQGSDPKVALQISRDNGHTFGGERVTNFGKIGQYISRAEWRRLGLARDWVFRIRVTDPVKFVIIGAVIEGLELNK